METFFQDYLERLQRLHGDIEAVLEGLPQAGLDWSPGGDMNSLCILAIHVAGAERYLIGDVVAQEPSGRDREAEFHARGWDAKALKARLEEVLSYSRGVLGSLSLQDLPAMRLFPRDGRQVSVGWTLAHVLGHTAIHAGHMQVTSQFWKLREQK